MSENKDNIKNHPKETPLSRGRGAGGEGEKGLPLHAGAEPHQFRHARELRREMTRAEKALWKELRARRFLKLKFRRQHPLLVFIADFYCHEIKLIIEVDGKYHEEDDVSYYDSERTKELHQYGFTVIRFSNDEILIEMDKVLRKLKELVIQLRKASPQTPHQLERGFRSKSIIPSNKSHQSPKSTPSPRGEGRGEVKKKGSQS